MTRHAFAVLTQLALMGLLATPHVHAMDDCQQVASALRFSGRALDSRTFAYSIENASTHDLGYFATRNGELAKEELSLGGADTGQPGSPTSSQAAHSDWLLAPWESEPQSDPPHLELGPSSHGVLSPGQKIERTIDVFALVDQRAGNAAATGRIPYLPLTWISHPVEVRLVFSLDACRGKEERFAFSPAHFDMPDLCHGDESCKAKFQDLGSLLRSLAGALRK